MYQQFLADPDSVDQAWHEFFADYRPGSPVGGGDRTTAVQSANGGSATQAPAQAAPKAEPAKAAPAKTEEPKAAPAKAEERKAAPAKAAPAAPVGAGKQS